MALPNPMPAATSLKLLGVLALVMGMSPSIGFAGFALRPYIEFGAGVSQIRDSADFFDANNATSPTFNTALGLTIAVDLSAQAQPIPHFHLGLAHRVSNSNEGGLNYGVQASYLILRGEYHGAFVTLGAAPLTVWRRYRYSAGLDYYSRAPNALGALGEAGYMWTIVPAFSIGLVGSAQAMFSGNTISPKPIISGSVLFRFYFIAPNKFAQEKRVFWEDEDSQDYPGFRYPFGVPKD